ncbi:MAG: inositol monophosphatase family protein [Patescibacteria group bacterium]|jgi:myo-inositol-1(or 4)-monophosphatase
MITEKYKIIIEAAEAGGKIVKEYFGEALELEDKGMAANFRTKADLGSERVILEILEREFPDYNIYSEEAGKIAKGSEYEFIIDPLDGTNNFFLGIPNFGVSIALAHKGEVIFGVIHQPITGETFWAEKGQGTWMDGKKIQTSNEGILANSTICHTTGYEGSREQISKFRIAFDQIGIKRWMENWSIAVDCTLIALGRVEVLVNSATEIYDYAAGKLIAEEAGAVILYFDEVSDRSFGSEYFVICANKSICEAITPIIKSALSKK